MYLVSAFPPPPKATARLAEARFAREGGRRTVGVVRLTSLRQGYGGPPERDVFAVAREGGSRTTTYYEDMKNGASRVNL